MAYRWIAPCLLLRCSLFYAELPSGQCASDNDCEVGLGLAGATCDLEYAVCVRADALEREPADTRRMHCVTDAPGDASCGAGGSCSPLQTPECPCVSGDWQDPDALVIGSIAPHTFRTGAGESREIPYVPRWLRAIDLGLAEWRDNAAGGRLARTDRPLALLHCNSNDDLPQARRAMAHLIDVAHAPVVLTVSDVDTNAVRFQALRQGTSLICSGCFAAAPEDPELTRLVWQIAPPLVDQAPLAIWRVAELARGLRAAAQAPEQNEEPALEVLLLSQDYPGINELVNEVQLGLSADVGYRITAVQTPAPRDQGTVQLEVARAVIAARPRIIVVGMDTDFTTYYLPMIEGEWPLGVPRPRYVLTHLNQELGLLGGIARDIPDLPERLGGTGWAVGPEVARNLAGLSQRFESSYGEGIENAHYGYDAVYAALYALMLTERSRSISGVELSKSLSLLGAGPTTHVGPSALPSATSYLLSGQSLDLVGTTNELDWHPTTHQTRSEVGLWCLSRAANGELGLLADTGPRWQPEGGLISGTYACPGGS